MESSTLIHKIESLPEALQAEIVDFVEFLLQKYQIDQELDTSEGLSLEEKEELLSRQEKMRAQPETKMSIEDFKSQILEKYARK